MTMRTRTVPIPSHPRQCGGCGVFEGHFHVPGCDMERCPFCGGQLSSCGCDHKHFYPNYVSFRDIPPTRLSLPTREEEAHARGCTSEGCPTCKVLEASGRTSGLPPPVYFNGLSPAQQDEWARLLQEKGLIPWVCYPTICARCGLTWPDLFMVEDAEWEKYIEPAMRGSVLCHECYTCVKTMIEEAARERG